jgi:hypothetical protein
MKRCIAVALIALFPAWAETPEEWIALEAHVCGAFGAFVPLGIKIGLDASEPRCYLSRSEDRSF